MRERLQSRLGFLMLAAGSAVGLGNVWRFPYVVGMNGGAVFVLIYLAFLALLGFPLLVAELGIGRGAQRSLAAALTELAPPPTRPFWRRWGAILASGCFVLMIYYTDVAGWLLKYTGDFMFGRPPVDPDAAFKGLCASPALCGVFMALAVVVATVICLFGVVRGVERVTKVMMISLLMLLGVLAIRSLTLPGACEGLAFYLKPDWGAFLERPWEIIFHAMGQSFFTLSLGIGSMTICGSYVNEDRSLVSEAFWIILIDTAVALMSGLIIFPACATYHVPYTQGDGLIFVALPKVFAQMSGGRCWGLLFFLFLACAALTTVIAVFECLIAALMDSRGMTRKWASLLIGAGVALLSLPCVLWGSVLKWEDFAVTQLWLPLGALTQGFFVLNGTYGWGWSAFRESVSRGAGWKLPDAFRLHFAVIIPILIIAVLVVGLCRFKYGA